MKYSILDWMWFLFYLKGNEFSGKINLNMKKIERAKNSEEAMQKDSERVVKQRKKAHEMDIQWSAFKFRLKSKFGIQA